ncbi:MAG: hypothetical protein HC896_16945 [Bacteroidales bacterium]|nr:hypothetical protein [Bacteroidales bacterium]
MIEVECHISIKKNGNCFLGAAKTELLKEIIHSGSLSGAAKKAKNFVSARLEYDR